jgi:hypothetical protein
MGISKLHIIAVASIIHHISSKNKTNFYPIKQMFLSLIHPQCPWIQDKIKVPQLNLQYYKILRPSRTIYCWELVPRVGCAGNHAGQLSVEERGVWAGCEEEFAACRV